ncbi:MAG: hypothetical protein GYA48_12360 [Chloroflexi bacterium]|nr:hypothetical protein [Chloroflexota bacterium]
MGIDLLFLVGVIVLVCGVSFGVALKIFRKEVAIPISLLLLAWSLLAIGGGYAIAKLGMNALNGVVLGAILFLLSGAALYAIRSFLQPLKVLTEALQRMSTGDIQFDAEMEGGRLGELLESLQGVIRYYQEYAQKIETIATGNLTDEIVLKGNKDEFGRSLGKMTGGLRTIVSQVTASADKMSQTAHQVSNAAQRAQGAVNQIGDTIEIVAGGTHHQLEQVTQTTAAVETLDQTVSEISLGADEQTQAIQQANQFTEQMKTAIDQVAARAHTGAQGSAQAARAAQTAASVIHQSLDGMGQINQSAMKVNQSVSLMGKHSEKIGSIVEVIDEISSQTNLLALNAAIEAARAGEHGKGFAVVADEVRKLAEKSALATKEISTLVKDIQNTVADTEQAIEDEAHLVEEGVRYSHEAEQALNNILEVVSSIELQVGEIAAASDEISATSNSLVEVMDSVSVVAEQNRQATHQIARQSGAVRGTVEAIMELSRENDRAVKNMKTAAEEMQTQVTAVTDSMLALDQVSVDLQQHVLKFTTKKISGKVSRGSALIGRLDFVREVHGKDALEKVLWSMSAEDQRVLRKKIEPQAEYPSELLGALTQAIKNVLAGGKDDILREMTAYRAKFDILPGGALEQHFKAGDPGFTIRRMDLCLRHNWGDGVVVINEELGENHILQKVDMGRKQPRERCTFNHVGWMEGVIREAGGIPHIRKTRCMYDGHPYCEYDIRWEMNKNGHESLKK